MTNFICEPLDDGTSIALWVQHAPSARNTTEEDFTCVRVYGSRDQYPLTPDRYVKNRPNLFLDIVDLLDGNSIETDVGQSSANVEYPAAEADEQTQTSDSEHTSDSTSNSNSISKAVRTRGDFTRTITVKALCQKAAHSAADGSGNARRFKDARGLWQRVNEHTLVRALKVDDEPIIDVRKTHNWKRNQPYKTHSANPVAWYVSQVYSRSNIQKNPIQIYAGLHGIFAATTSPDVNSEQADIARSLREQWDNNALMPTYQQIAEIVADSNMLVFHNTQSLITWIREQMRAQEVVAAPTPCVLHIDPEFAQSWIVGDSQHDSALQALNVAKLDDETELRDGQTMTVGHYANVLEQYIKQRS
ncbi:hypothetical protein GCM10007377_08340 [Galliscardovia ingluviei]|uniref:Uncharacterized protein n=1 Tax=Galliscardovia ingluviei TaxID=1769422 RepID=A0A8J3AHJ7_9BIFI|nr:hypothetical protein [Galliscardovia ingluviei]GGI13919.1 hypothetical protein GCM10007377_08340 [Galliscardovia ingluviei]